MKIFNTHLILSVACVMALMSSCKKSFLDVVPDNVATIDNAFANRNEAEKFLFTLYNNLPQEGHPETNPVVKTFGRLILIISPVAYRTK
jgi:hypothetical protein